MKSIKLIQYGSAVAVLLTILFMLVAGTAILFFETKATMDELFKLAMIIGIFLSPEVLAAFFGNYLKRRQNGAEPR